MTIDDLLKTLKEDEYVELSPEENHEIVEYLESYKEHDIVFKMYKAVNADKQHRINKLEAELEVYKKALELTCKDLADFDSDFHGPFANDKDYWFDLYLKKAREE